MPRTATGKNELPVWDSQSGYAIFPFTNEISYRPEMGNPGEKIDGTDANVIKGMNEGFQDVSPKKDGYLIGVGAGSFIQCLDIMSDSPKGIVLMDIMPEVVLSGRVFAEFIKGSQTTEGLIANMSDEKKLETVLRDIQRRSFDLLGNYDEGIRTEIINRVKDHMIKDIKSGFLNKKVKGFLMPALERNYNKLKHIVDGGRFVTILGDMTDKKTLDTLKNELYGFDSSNNLWYISNIIDHVTDRGHKPKKLSGFTEAIAHMRNISPSGFAYTDQIHHQLQRYIGPDGKIRGHTGYLLHFSDTMPDYSDYQREYPLTPTRQRNLVSESYT